MENKWILEDAVSILKTLGHINLWYLEEQFGQLPATRIIVSDDNRTVAMWSEQKHGWEREKGQFVDPLVFSLSP